MRTPTLLFQFRSLSAVRFTLTVSPYPVTCFWPEIRFSPFREDYIFPPPCVFLGPGTFYPQGVQINLHRYPLKLSLLKCGFLVPFHCQTSPFTQHFLNTTLPFNHLSNHHHSCEFPSSPLCVRVAKVFLPFLLKTGFCFSFISSPFCFSIFLQTRHPTSSLFLPLVWLVVLLYKFFLYRVQVPPFKRIRLLPPRL